MWRKYLLAIIFFLAVLAYALPWKTWLEQRLKSELAARGVGQLEFSIASVGFKEIAFKDIAFGDLKLPAFSVSYKLLELLHGNFRELHAETITLHKGKLEITLRNVDASLVSGQWKIEEIIIVGAPVSLPPLAGNGTLKYADRKILLAGDIQSKDAKTRAGFSFDYSIPDSKSAKVKITSASLPWNGGVLSAQNISVPVFSDAPIAITLKVRQVSLNELLAAATANRASATGAVSGTVPIIIARDGAFTVRKGYLQADKAGTIILSPDVIPGDTPQVALLREVLQNFHYSVFSMGIESADNKQLSMLLSLEGNNPDVYNGRSVKLNVHLAGDVIDLITQSLNILK